jgi:hypothetical protein
VPSRRSPISVRPAESIGANSRPGAANRAHPGYEVAAAPGQNARHSARTFRRIAALDDPRIAVDGTGRATDNRLRDARRADDGRASGIEPSTRSLGSVRSARNVPCVSSG